MRRPRLCVSPSDVIIPSPRRIFIRFCVRSLPKNAALSISTSAISAGSFSSTTSLQQDAIMRRAPVTPQMLKQENGIRRIKEAMESIEGQIEAQARRINILSTSHHLRKVALARRRRNGQTELHDSSLRQARVPPSDYPGPHAGPLHALKTALGGRNRRQSIPVQWTLEPNDVDPCPKRSKKPAQPRQKNADPRTARRARKADEDPVGKVYDSRLIKRLGHYLRPYWLQAIDLLRLHLPQIPERRRGPLSRHGRHRPLLPHRPRRFRDNTSEP